MPTTDTRHILLDDSGVAWIDDTNVKVIEVVLDKLAHHSSPEEMHFQYPHLSLAQIHAALTYYHDHQEAFDAQIKRELEEFDALAAASESTSPIRAKLRATGKLLDRRALHGRPRSPGRHSRAPSTGRRCPDGPGG